MSFVIPEHSRTKVDKAGIVLIAPGNHTEKEYHDAYEVMANWRAAHAYPINTFQATLRYRLRNMKLSALVAQRLKRMPSIVGKLCRQKGMKLSRMQDIGGLRAVVDSIPKVRALEKIYREKKLSHELVDYDDYIDTPKKDGYRSVHLVYKYHGKVSPEYENLRLELQLRTKQQHAWATAVETMSTYLNTSLKAGEGDEKWKQYFCVASNALAHIEKAPLVPGYENLDRTGSVLLLAELEEELSVLSQLRGYSIATDQITSGGKGEYHLVVLNTVNKSVDIRSYPKDKLDLANEDYASVESLPEYGAEIEAVLVSVDSIKALKTAYPNYFLDTHEFVLQMDRLVREAKKTKEESLPSSIRGYIKEGLAPHTVMSSVDEALNVSLSSKNVPQAEDFDSIKMVLKAINSGCKSKEDISEYTGYSIRHVNYRLVAAELLGCVKFGEYVLSTAGKTWLRRNSGTKEEAEYLKSLIENTAVFKSIVPDLFDTPGPSRAKIAKRISVATGMSASTADRRAATLVSWANKLRQGRLIAK